MAISSEKHGEPASRPNSGQRLFPLPLTTFERYLLADDRASHPMVFPMEFEFSGKISRPAFEAALAEALTLHPLLQAHVEFPRFRTPRFVDAQGQTPVIDWDAEGVPRRFANGMAIDLRREVGLRIWVRQGAERTTLTFQFHHACCDGIGAGRFLGDLFAAYGKRTAVGENVPKNKPLAPETLRTRGIFNVEYPAPVSLRQIIWATVCEAAKWATRRPSPLAIVRRPEVLESRDDAEGVAEYPGVEVHWFDEPESRVLRQHASRLGGTVNDLLLRDLFQTMRAWNRQHSAGCGGPLGKKQWLQINMPQSLRTPGRDEMPAANKMSYVFLTRRTSELDDSQKLLEGICEETNAIKEWSLGLYFIAGLAAVLRVPGLLPLFLRGRRCFATAVLSNLGDFSRRLVAVFPRENGRIVAGNLRLESFRIVPPYRPETHAGFVAATYAQRLSIHLHCDPSRFSPADTRELLAAYVARLSETIAEGRAAGPAPVNVAWSVDSCGPNPQWLQ